MRLPMQWQGQTPHDLFDPILFGLVLDGYLPGDHTSCSCTWVSNTCDIFLSFEKYPHHQMTIGETI